jgi:hypothetical protein
MSVRAKYRLDFDLAQVGEQAHAAAQIARVVRRSMARRRRAYCSCSVRSTVNFSIPESMQALYFDPTVSKSALCFVHDLFLFDCCNFCFFLASSSRRSKAA